MVRKRINIQGCSGRCQVQLRVNIKSVGGNTVVGVLKNVPGAAQIHMPVQIHGSLHIDAERRNATSECNAGKRPVSPDVGPDRRSDCAPVAIQTCFLGNQAGREAQGLSGDRQRGGDQCGKEKSSCTIHGFNLNLFRKIPKGQMLSVCPSHILQFRDGNLVSIAPITGVSIERLLR